MNPHAVPFLLAFENLRDRFIRDLSFYEAFLLMLTFTMLIAAVYKFGEWDGREKTIREYKKKYEIKEKELNE